MQQKAIRVRDHLHFEKANGYHDAKTIIAMHISFLFRFDRMQFRSYKVHVKMFCGDVSKLYWPLAESI